MGENDIVVIEIEGPQFRCYLIGQPLWEFMAPAVGKMFLDKICDKAEVSQNALENLCESCFVWSAFDLVGYKISNSSWQTIEQIECLVKRLSSRGNGSPEFRCDASYFTGPIPDSASKFIWVGTASGHFDLETTCNLSDARCLL